jgi:hypothetical protein
MKMVKKFLKDWIENAETGIFRPGYERYMQVKFDEWTLIRALYVTYKVTDFFSLCLTGYKGSYNIL